MSDVARWLDELGAPRKAVQRPAAEALAHATRTDPAVRARLAELLAAPEPRRRWGAAYALALAEPMPLDALPVLLEALAGDDGDVRWASANIVTRMMSASPAVTTTVRGLVDSPMPVQRKMALYCLRDAGVREPSPVAEIRRGLGDAHASVRLAALTTAAALLPPTSATAADVARLLDDDDAGVRRAAAATLGRLGVADHAVTTALERAAATTDRALARAAEDALSRLGARAPARR